MGRQRTHFVCKTKHDRYIPLHASKSVYEYSTVRYVCATRGVYRNNNAAAAVACRYYFGANIIELYFVYVYGMM